MVKKYQFYIGGLTTVVSGAASEREAYGIARQQIIQKHGGLSTWLRGLLNGRDTVRSIDNRSFKNANQLAGKKTTTTDSEQS